MVLAELIAAEAPVAAAAGLVSSLDLTRGAIIGAMLISAAFLAGVAVLRSSAAAFSGFVMVASAGIVLAFWLGLAGEPGPALSPLLQGIFAASALIFLSATAPLVSGNRFLGGVLFAGALSILGIAILNVALIGEATSLQRMGLYAAAAAIVGISGIDALRGDSGARLILPGAILACAAPLVFGMGGIGAFALAPQAMFAVGVLMASLVALVSPAAGRAMTGFGGDLSSQRFDGGDRTHGGRRNASQSPHDAARVSENQLAQVLDYSGIAVWDWSRMANHQTASFGELMGADCDGAFTPEALREFIHPEEVHRFEHGIFGPSEGDGGFDEVIRLIGGNAVRMRGARAVAKDGDLERIVIFLERSECVGAHEAVKPDALKLAAVSLTGAAAIAAPAERCHDIASPHHNHTHRDHAAADRHENRRHDDPAVAKSLAPANAEVIRAVDDGSVTAAFQPIVSFETGKVCGAEALLRIMRDGALVEGEGAEEFVRKAAIAGRGRAVASAMLKQAAAHAADRIKAGDTSYFASVNISASQLLSEDFVADVRSTISEHRLPPRALVIELTEAERLVETPEAARVLKALRSAGAALAYDDFGAGFSSLSNLHRYEFDFLKIDRSFLDDIAANGGKKKIASALAKLGRDFGMTVIAEGIESEQTAKIAKAIGCKMGQGFHLGSPAIAGAKTSVDGLMYAANSQAPANSQLTAGVLLDGHLDAEKPVGRPLRRRLFGAKAH
ncbi:MAG: EAL domain-containing protein [Parvularculaceae bacterium]